ncbi:MAG: hypothetical protein K5663_04495 [Clostridiales bacterium]|nr:hypothetical protein [Clostridiales bacterium]
MKKALLVLLALLLTPLLLGEVSLPAEAAHKHKWEDEEVVAEPTCIQPGSKIQVCYNCPDSITGRSTRTVEIPALGHKWGKRIWVKQPDCTHQGTFYRTCTRCGKKTETYREKALGHDWGKQVVTKKADCTHEGVYTSTCSRCKQQKTEKIKALGHDWGKQALTQKTDCTHEGVYTSTCSRCKQQKTVKTVKALGHDWDEGVITREPHGFTPGVRTFTCRRDSSHTYTEEVDPFERLFAGLENKPFDLANLTPIVITKQPVGGYVARESDEGIELSVEVKGGEPPYTYEWHQGSKSESLQNTASELANWLGGLLGLGQDEIDAMLAAQTDKIVGENEPVYHVTEGGHRYWCVVRDCEEQDAESDKVTVDFKIGIWTQPGSKNLSEGSPVYLECKAYNGSGEYTYEWFKWNDSEGDDFYMGSEMPLPVAEAGEYYCIAMDAVTGSTAESDNAVVYEAQPLTIEIIDGDQTLSPDETGMLTAKVSGGVPPYEGKWSWPFHDELFTETTESDENVFIAQTEKAGWYTFDVKDSMNNVASANVYRYDKQLDILEQPKGGILPKGGAVEMSILVGGGEGPYTFILYRNGEEYIRGENDTPTMNGLPYGFRPYNPGNYYFYVVDSHGAYCISDTVIVEEEEFLAIDLTPTAEIFSAYSPVELRVRAEGGAEPYEYMWLKINDDNVCTRAGDNSPVLRTNVPGEYFCVVTDNEKNTASSPAMTAAYAYTKPLILEQPKDTYVELNEDGSLKATLTCRAVTDKGKSDGLKYIWEWRGEKSWYQLSELGPTVSVVSAGMYRCNVVDVATGESVYSNNVFVAEKLECVEAEYLGRAYISGLGYYAFKIKGGIGPYTINCYYLFDLVDYIRDILYETRTVEDSKGVDPFENKLPMYMEFINYRETPPHQRSSETSWYVVVTDASGQECTSEIVSWRDIVIQHLSD